MSEPYCRMCKCVGNPPGVPDDFNANWACPLLFGKTICQVCCHHDLNGGMGAEDTLLDMCRKSGKTPWEVHKACVACKHGGPGLDDPPVMMAFRVKGKMISEGKDFDAAKDKDVERFRRKLEALKTMKVPEKSE